MFRQYLNILRSHINLWPSFTCACSDTDRTDPAAVVWDARLLSSLSSTMSTTSVFHLCWPGFAMLLQVRPAYPKLKQSLGFHGACFYTVNAFLIAHLAASEGTNCIFLTYESEKCHCLFDADYLENTRQCITALTVRYHTKQCASAAYALLSMHA